MKFDFNWPCGYLEKKCLNILMAVQYEQPCLKDQRSTLTLGAYLYSHRLISLNISSEYNGFGFSRLKIKRHWTAHLNPGTRDDVFACG